MKVEGQLNSDGTKDFRIEFEGEHYLACRHGQKFRLHGDGFTGTLKAIKQKIILDALSDVTVEMVDESSEWLWSCVHPCALLIHRIQLGGNATPDELKTLDAFGWLTDDRKPAFKKAEQEYERWTCSREIRRERRYDATDDGPTESQKVMINEAIKELQTESA